MMLKRGTAGAALAVLASMACSSAFSTPKIQKCTFLSLCICFLSYFIISHRTESLKKRSAGREIWRDRSKLVAWPDHRLPLELELYRLMDANRAGVFPFFSN